MASSMKNAFESGEYKIEDLEETGVLPPIAQMFKEVDQLGEEVPFTNDPDPVLAALLFAQFMAALGLDPADPHLEDTPGRVTKMYLETLHPETFDFTVFAASPDEQEQMISVAEIPFSSFCAHHLLPFTGTAHVAYIPDTRIGGLSKFARMVEHYARRPQVQERMTAQIATALEEILEPRGVAVTLDARHSCMELRGPKAHGAVTRTTVLRGAFKENPETRAEYFARMGGL